MTFCSNAACGTLDLWGSRAPAWPRVWEEICHAAKALPLTSLAAEPADLAASTVDLLDIQSVLRGDDQAYARLVHRYQQQIASQVWRASRRRDDCEELVQEVFVEAYLSLARFKARSPLLHWLRKITTRVCYRYWKRQARLRRHISLSDGQWSQIARDETAQDSANLAAQRVHDLLSRLPPRDRMVMTLVLLEGCSVAEAAELTGWSRTMVKVQCYRARQKLRSLVNEVSQ